MSPLQTRPVLIFKDDAGASSLPIWLGPAGAQLAAVSATQEVNFHSLSLKLLESAKIRIDRCEFNEIHGHHQYVNLEISGHPELKRLRVRADEAIPLCSAQKTRFFSTEDFIMQCRDLDVAMLSFEQSLRLQPEIVSKKQAYVM